MQQFHYSARDAAGSMQVGTMLAASPTAAASDLAARGWVPLNIRAEVVASARDQITIKIPALFKRSGVSAHVQQAMGLAMRELAALLKAGIPILRALKLTSDAAHDDAVRESLQRIAADLDSGRDLSSSAQREKQQSGMLSDYDVAMLSVGERTGRLTESLFALHKHRQFMRATKEQVASALRYPAFVIFTCMAAVVVVNIFVIPSFKRVFANLHTELPLLTRVLMGLSEFMVSYWHLLAVAVLGVVFGFRAWVNNEEGRLVWDKFKLRIPIVGPILRGILMTRFTESFSASFSAGLTVNQALDVTAQTLDNSWVELRVRGMCSDLERGSSISAAARNAAFFPPTLLQLISIGEETGALDELLGEMSLHYQSEVEYAIKRLSATLEPLLIWLLGMGVLVLALGVFMPMWELGRASIH
jgi:MSHA biogenesis protein MshG